MSAQILKQQFDNLSELEKKKFIELIAITNKKLLEAFFAGPAPGLQNRGGLYAGPSPSMSTKCPTCGR